MVARLSTRRLLTIFLVAVLTLYFWCFVALAGIVAPNDNDDGGNGEDVRHDGGKGGVRLRRLRNRSRSSRPSPQKQRMQRFLGSSGEKLDPDRFKKAFEAVPEKITSAAEMKEHLSLLRAENDDEAPSTSASSSSAFDSDVIYFITPTHHRDTQWLDLVRLSQTLAHDPRIYWIIVEDASAPTWRIRDLMERTGLMFAHVAEMTDPEYKKRKKAHRGVAQRNRALDLIDSLVIGGSGGEGAGEGDKSATITGPGGVIYFGDDDNAYDVRLFAEIRKTKYVGVFGVAFRGAGLYERCIVDNSTDTDNDQQPHKVASLATNLVWNRKFPMDMGGYAFRASAVHSKHARFSNSWPSGTLETRFVEQLLEKVEELEALADDCRQIYVWHVKTNGISGRLGDSVKPDEERDLIKNFV